MCIHFNMHFIYIYIYMCVIWLRYTVISHCYVCDIVFIQNFSGTNCHGPAGGPGMATRCLCVLSTWLFVFVGAMCSSVYCLSPPILLPHHRFSGSTCVPLITLVCLPIYPPGVCSPVLIRCLSSCVCYVDCYSSLPACPFFTFGVIFVHFCFILWLKRNHSLALESSPHLSPHAPWHKCVNT